MAPNRTQKLRKIKDEVLSLTHSPLFAYRQKNHYYPVIGQGSHHAKIMFIGEAPGLNEAKTGKPFCGAAGKILDQLLKDVNLNRQDIYITNILKDRPPANRDPRPEEIKLYAPFLVKQIQIIKPQTIATLGRFSMDFIIRLFHLENQLKPISQIHGRLFTAKAPYGPITIIPLYHPAVAIYNPTKLPLLKTDFQIFKKLS